MNRHKVLFVCYGNICRSPSAEGMFRHLTMRAEAGQRFDVDSAGTSGMHAGEPPDPRSVAAAAERGIDISMLRARQVDLGDFSRFDLILAMDRQNLQDLRQLGARLKTPPRSEIRLVMDFAQSHPLREVPDPYYGGGDGFERVLDMLEQAGAGLLYHLLQRS